MRKGILLLLVVLLFFTRFAGLDWGLPYPFHPDERNMASAIQSLRCDSFDATCLHPHFFAYGQLPLYIAYFGIQAVHLLGGVRSDITYIEATMALRIISAIASFATAFVLMRLIPVMQAHTLKGHMAGLLKRHDNLLLTVFFFLAITFTPYFIQFSHFGTTESLLMFFYTTLVFLSLRYVEQKGSRRKTLLIMAVITGAAIATKISSLIFLAVPVGTVAWTNRSRPLRAMLDLAPFILVSALTAIAGSPHNLISYTDFLSAIQYESWVGTGTYQAFYTRQFANTIPVLFQLEKIFPYALGVLPFLFATGAFLFLPWNNKFLNLLRFFMLAYFLPTSFLFTKWTRFMAPIFPLLTVFALLGISSVFSKKPRFEGLLAALILMIAPGIAYLTVYLQPDIRLQTSDWIYRNIPANSRILSETANVIDIPVPTRNNPQPRKNFQYASFDFYGLDENKGLKDDLKEYIDTADYIIVPTRRVFANHPSSLYPLTAKYYQDLFSGRLEFEEVAVFANDFIGLSDEAAEETWSVFDHPVVRIYKRSAGDRQTNEESPSDLLSYPKLDYTINDKTYRLLVADTPQRRERGLMHVRTREEIGMYDGMLFTFPDHQTRYFWNKNTVADLEIYWVRSGEIIGKTNLPSIEKSGKIVTVFSPAPSDTVIELLP